MGTPHGLPFAIAATTFVCAEVFSAGLKEIPGHLGNVGKFEEEHAPPPN